MRVLVLLLILAGVGAYYWKDRREISETKISRYVRAHVDAMQRKDAEALCNQLAPDFQGNYLRVAGGSLQAQQIDRKQSCQNLQEFFDLKISMDRTLPAGSEYAVDYSINVDRIDISADKKQATVQTRSRLNLANLMTVDSTTTDTLRMLDGAVVMQASEGRVRVSGAAIGARP
ncbi:hypothetical protein M8A51_24100 [Schlegelella sp. S2-27]|uniref:LPS export ABC transporter periplasmic protein LptC n=1 Tax=Caldimonas mangrovi TaxID=2944811 RepID=A0ABT0YV42_9BURK|nr:hypothetical protein [Caldimonas mangrovi]MCM5682626.1 hypothetical protein [Caldimonas mangrovi]